MFRGRARRYPASVPSWSKPLRPFLFAIAFTTAASGILADPPQPAKDGIVWEASFDLAKTKAAAEGKLLFVEFLTDG